MSGNLYWPDYPGWETAPADAPVSFDAVSGTIRLESSADLGYVVDSSSATATTTIYAVSGNQTASWLKVTASLYVNSVVYGGAASAFTVGSTHVYIDGGSVSTVYGGGNTTGNSENTYLVFDNDASVSSVYGGGRKGWMVSDTAHVIFDSCTVSNNVYGGGNGADCSVTNTDIVINGGTFASNKGIYTGGELGSSTVNGSITVNSTATVASYLYGGGNNSVVTNASITIDGAVSMVYGGGSGTDAVTDSVEILFRGSASNSMFGGGTKSAVVDAASITIDGGTLTVNWAGIYGGGRGVSTTGDVNITVKGSSDIAGYIYGSGNNGGVVTGNVSITLADNAILGGGVYLGENNSASTIAGSAQVTIVGDAVTIGGKNLNGSYYNASGVLSYGELILRDVTGTNYDGKVKDFNTLTIQGNSSIGTTFTVNGKFGGELVFDLTGKTESTLAMLDAGNTQLAGASGVSVNIAESDLVNGTAYTISTGGEWIDIAALKVNGEATDNGVYTFANGYTGTFSYADGNLIFTVAGASGPVIIDENTVTDEYHNNGGSSLTVNGASVSGNLFAHLADGETLTVNSGTLNQVFAGSNNNSDASSGSIKTSLSGGTFTRVIAGHAVSDGTVNTAETVLSISGNLDSAGSAPVWNYGGGIVRNTGTSNITKSTIEVISGSAGNVIGGGRTEKGGTMTVSAVEVTVSGGTVETLTAGSYINKGGSGTVSSATLNLSSSATAVFGGGMVVESGNAEVGSAQINITAGASVSNAVFGGSYLTGGSSLVKSVTVNLSASGINPVANGIYGGDFVSGGEAAVNEVNINLNSGNLDCCIIAGGYAMTGGVSTVNTAVISINSAANLTGYIYLGGYADGGNCTVENASVIFDGVSNFAGDVIGEGISSKGGVSTVNSSSVTLNAYSGNFAGDLLKIDVLNITADSSAVLTGSCDSGLINVTGISAEMESHAVFDLSETDFDIARITVDGAALQEVEAWEGLGFGYDASEGKFAVVQFADKADFEGYTFYTTLA